MSYSLLFWMYFFVGVVKDYIDLGDKSYRCVYCGAYFWLNESLKQSLKKMNPFLLCAVNKEKLSFQLQR